MSEAAPTPIKNRRERRHPQPAPQPAQPVKAPEPIMTLDAAQDMGLRTALAKRDAAGAAWNEADGVVRKVMASLGLDPDKAYPLGVNGEVYPPQ